MSQSQDLQGATGMQFPSQVSCDQNFDQHNSISEAPLEDSSKKIRLESIKIVQNLIERCMRLYMSKEEVLKFLSETLGIGHGFATLVWQKLEEENAGFFQIYNTRLRVKKQILCFNDLLEKQYSLMVFKKHENMPLGPMPSGSHQMNVNNLPVGYPTLQQSAIPSTVQPLIGYGIPETSSLHTLGNDFVPCSSMMMDTTLKPTTMAPAGPFHFTSQGPPGQNIDNPARDSIFASDVTGTEGLPIEPDGGSGMYSFQSFYPVTWDSSFTDPNPDLLSSFEGTEEFFADAASDSVTRKEEDFQVNESIG